ncbi:hypothetical protein WJX74_000714 [Apatococcus lobatus]|uniref:Uncharacterized protein n=1 Tax=Apatococcus lobatus TaxID=904363 RepID=A0AAW1R3N8_9CHLO
MLKTDPLAAAGPELIEPLGQGSKGGDDNEGGKLLTRDPAVFVNLRALRNLTLDLHEVSIPEIYQQPDKAAGSSRNEVSWGRNPFQPRSAHQQPLLLADTPDQPPASHADLGTHPVVSSPSSPVRLVNPPATASPCAGQLPDPTIHQRSLMNPASNAAAWLATDPHAEEPYSASCGNGSSKSGCTVIVQRGDQPPSVRSASSDRLSGQWTDAANGLTSASGSPSTSDWEAVPLGDELLEDGVGSEGSADDRFAEAEAMGLPGYLVNKRLCPKPTHKAVADQTADKDSVADNFFQGTAAVSLQAPPHLQQQPGQHAGLGVQMAGMSPALEATTQLHDAAAHSGSGSPRFINELGMQMARTAPALEDSTQLPTATPAAPLLETQLLFELGRSSKPSTSESSTSQSSASTSSSTHAGVCTLPPGSVHASPWQPDHHFLEREVREMFQVDSLSNSDATLAPNSDQDDGCEYRAYYTAHESFSAGSCMGALSTCSSGQVASQAGHDEVAYPQDDPSAQACSSTADFCSQLNSSSFGGHPSRGDTTSCTAPSAPVLQAVGAFWDPLPESETSSVLEAPSAPSLDTTCATWANSHNPEHSEATFSHGFIGSCGDTWAYTHDPDMEDIPLPPALSIDTASSARTCEEDPHHFRISVPSTYSEEPSIHSEEGTEASQLDAALSLPGDSAQSLKAVPESQRIFLEVQQLLGRTHDLPWASYGYHSSESNMARFNGCNDPAGVNGTADDVPHGLLQPSIAAGLEANATSPEWKHLSRADHIAMSCYEMQGVASADAQWRGWGAKWGQHWPASGASPHPLQDHACNESEWGPYEGYQASQEGHLASHELIDQNPVPWGPCPSITFGQGFLQAADLRSAPLHHPTHPLPAFSTELDAPNRGPAFCGPRTSCDECADTCLFPLADEARQACYNCELSEGCMQQLQLAMDLSYDSLRTTFQKYVNFPMWYLASCRDYFVANKARKALSEFEKLLDVASIPEQHLIMEMRTVPYGAALGYVIDACAKFEHMMRIHSWVETCRVRCIEALRAISVHTGGQDRSSACNVMFDFSSLKMLPAGMQWSEATYTAMWQQAAAYPRSDSSSSSEADLTSSPPQQVSNDGRYDAHGPNASLSSNAHASAQDQADVKCWTHTQGHCPPASFGFQSPSRGSVPEESCSHRVVHGSWAESYGAHAAAHGLQPAASHAGFGSWSPSQVSSHSRAQAHAVHAAALGFPGAASHASCGSWSSAQPSCHGFFHEHAAQAAAHHCFTNAAGCESSNGQSASTSPFDCVAQEQAIHAAAHGFHDATGCKHSEGWSTSQSSRSHGPWQSHINSTPVHSLAYQDQETQQLEHSHSNSSLEQTSTCQDQTFHPADQLRPEHIHGQTARSKIDVTNDMYGVFRNGFVVRQAAWQQGMYYMRQVPDMYVQSVRRQPTQGQIYTAWGKAFLMVQVLISAPNFSHFEDRDYLTHADLRKYPQMEAGKTKFAPLHQGLFMLDTCSAQTWITQEVAEMLGLSDMLQVPQETSERCVEVELNGQLMAVKICSEGLHEHVCVLGQDFLALQRQELVVNYACGSISMLDVE